MLTVATGSLAGASAAVSNRLVSAVAGAVIGVLATALIPVPRSSAKRADDSA